MSDGFERDIVFLGLTRPAMIAGVGWDWMFFNVMATIMIFLITASPFALGVFPVAHVIGLAIYAKDPQQVSVIAKRLKVGSGSNRKIWGGNSYSG